MLSPFFDGCSQWNLFEAILLPPVSANTVLSDTDCMILDTQIPDNMWEAALSKFRIAPSQFKKVREYYIDDLCDVYDYETDLHRVTQLRCIHDQIDSPWHMAVYFQDTFPTHRFPNTNDIEALQEKRVASVRISNRVHIIFEESDGSYRTIKVRAQNHEKMDQEKLQEDIAKALSWWPKK